METTPSGSMASTPGRDPGEPAQLRAPSARAPSTSPSRRALHLGTPGKRSASAFCLGEHVGSDADEASESVPRLARDPPHAWQGAWRQLHLDGRFDRGQSTIGARRSATCESSSARLRQVNEQQWRKAAPSESAGAKSGIWATPALALLEREATPAPARRHVRWRGVPAHAPRDDRRRRAVSSKRSRAARTASGMRRKGMGCRRVGREVARRAMRGPTSAWGRDKALSHEAVRPDRHADLRSGAAPRRAPVRTPRGRRRPARHSSRERTNGG